MKPHSFVAYFICHKRVNRSKLLDEGRRMLAFAPRQSLRQERVLSPFSPNLAGRNVKLKNLTAIENYDSGNKLVSFGMHKIFSLVNFFEKE